MKADGLRAATMDPFGLSGFGVVGCAGKECCDLFSTACKPSALNPKP